MTTPLKLTWSWRTLTVIPVLALAYLAGSNALVHATRESNPALALSFDGDDAMALALRADTQLAEAATQGKVIDVSAEARRSLRAQAVNPYAARLLGFGADGLGDHKRAFALNLIAEHLSRRESGAQLWLMEHAVERNDVAAVLARYDVLLRTNGNMYPQLLPKLALALSDPAIRNAFVPYVRKTPAWLPSLIGTAIGTPNPDALSYALRQAGGMPKGEAYQPFVPILLGQLFARQKFAEARAFYHSLPGSDPQMVTSAAFTQAGLDPKFAPVSWALESSATVSAVPEKDGAARSIRTFAPSGATGIAASKYLFIPPGTYRFGSAQTIITPSTNARASWVLRCASSADQAVIYQNDIIRTGRAAPPSDQVTIPANCTVQRLELNLAGGDDSAGLELSVARVEIGR